MTTLKPLCLKRRLKAQNVSASQCTKIFWEPSNPGLSEEMKKNVFEMALGLYACGIDIEKTTLFIQSEVPGHADLTWIFNTVTPLGDLERMTQFKDKAKQNRANINIGLLGYPVLQAADYLRIILWSSSQVLLDELPVLHDFVGFQESSLAPQYRFTEAGCR